MTDKFHNPFLAPKAPQLEGSVNEHAPEGVPVTGVVPNPGAVPVQQTQQPAAQDVPNAQASHAPIMN